jgi:hypothetical protein
MLLARGDPGDWERATSLAGEAMAIARDLGMARLQEQLSALVSESADGADRPTAATAAPPEPDRAGRAVLRREGDYWTISFSGPAFRLRDSKGLQHLARLVAEPNMEFHALDLLTPAGDPETPRPAGLEREELEARGFGDAGELLDPDAKAAYRRRLEALREELEQARAFNDPERAARAAEEIDFLSRELAGAVGLGGRDRKAASAAERARVNVTRAIKSAIERIAKNDSPLGRHLRVSVRTGMFCTYELDRDHPVSWEMDAAKRVSR